MAIHGSGGRHTTRQSAFRNVDSGRASVAIVGVAGPLVLIIGAVAMGARNIYHTGKWHAPLGSHA